MTGIVNRTTRSGQGRHQARLAVRQGFTLIELLVVIALTSILLIIVFKPLLDALNLSSRGSTQIEAQAYARSVLHDISATLSSADYVYDNAQTPINIWLLQHDGSQYPAQAQFAMLEYVPPAHQLDQAPFVPDPANPGQLIPLPTDPTTGEPISGSQLPAGQAGFAMPLAPGRILGRYFIGLRDNTAVNDAVNNTNGLPAVQYGNHFEDVTLPINKDNRYMLFKAEVTAYILDPTAANPQTAPYIPNLGLFHTVDANGNITDNKTDAIQLHDPNFFYDNSLAGDAGSKGDVKWAVPGWKDLNGDGKVEIWENWRAVATEIAPINKVDMIALDRDPNSNTPLFYDANGNLSTANNSRPHFRTLALFAPAYVQNDPGVPTSLDQSGNETPNPVTPTYLSQYSHWSTPFRLLLYRDLGGSDPVAKSPLDFYETTDGKKIVHVTTAMNVKPGDTPPDPAGLPDVGPKIDPKTGVFLNPNPQIAFAVDTQRGQVTFAFSSNTLLHDPAAPYAPHPQRYSPVDVDTAPLPQAGADPRRYLDLRTLPTTVWNGQQLNANGIMSPIDPNRNWTASIQPGSEIVFGPDQRPGPHYGYRIQYTRVSRLNGITGPNQYIINYTDIRNGQDPNDPRQRMGYIEFDSLPAAGFSQYNVQDDPANAVYPPHILPTEKRDPATGQNVPADAIEVNYKFQVNLPNDVVKIDYLTRDLINFSLEARLYDPRSSRPQITSVSDKIKVRNLQR